MSRFPSVQHKIATPFGAAYVHLSYDLATGRIVSAWLSYRNQLEDNRTTPDPGAAQISELLDAVSLVLDTAVKTLAQEYAFVEVQDDEDDLSTLQTINSHNQGQGI